MTMLNMESPLSRLDSGKQYSISCTHCRQRKIKCDKTYPCQNCQKGNVHCVFPERARYPKGRRNPSKRSNDELLQRLERMEQLLGNIDQGERTSPSHRSSESRSPEAQSDSATRDWVAEDRKPSKTWPSNEPPPDSLNRYMGHSFLRSLTSEVQGLKQYMEEDSDEDEQQPASTNEARLPDSAALFGSTLSAPKDLRYWHPPPVEISQLCSLYIENVDPVYKILHMPSLRDLVTDAVADVEAIPKGTYIEAMLFAMYYAATCSLSQEQCLKQFQNGRETLLAKYRAGVERALSNANFLCECDLGTLQALCIYLVSIRSNDNSQFSWTMLAIAVRLAHALGLNREGSQPEASPFQQEMRRRTWWGIVVLDIRCAGDVSTDRMVEMESFNTKQCLNVNDCDLDPNGPLPPREREGFTEMTRTNISVNMVTMVGRLAFNTPAGRASAPAGRLEAKMDMLKKVEEYVVQQVFPICDMTVPIQWVVAMVGNVMIQRSRLAVYYPLQYNSSEPEERPKVSREHLLETAVLCIEYSHHINTSPTAAQYRWFISTYVQWHAVAAALAQLCIQTKGPLVDRAWKIIDTVFDDWGTRVADSQHGRLWRPIKKLRSKAQAQRNEALMSAFSLNNQPAMMPTQQPQHQPQRQRSIPSPSARSIPVDSIQNPGLTSTAQPAAAAAMGAGTPMPQFDATTMSFNQPFQFNDPIFPNEFGNFAASTADAANPINWEEWDQFMQDSQLE